jgi:hypothetical protein
MTRRCVSCDGSMAGKRPQALYCSPKCQQREHKRRQPGYAAKRARFIEWKAATGRRTGHAQVVHTSVHRLHNSDLCTCANPPSFTVPPSVTSALVAACTGGAHVDRDTTS